MGIAAGIMVAHDSSTEGNLTSSVRYSPFMLIAIRNTVPI
jgi:hypothetical protein